jgi:ribosomal protein S27AE
MNKLPEIRLVVKELDIKDEIKNHNVNCGFCGGIIYLQHQENDWYAGRCKVCRNFYGIAPIEVDSENCKFDAKYIEIENEVSDKEI